MNSYKTEECRKTFIQVNISKWSEKGAQSLKGVTYVSTKEINM